MHFSIRRAKKNIEMLPGQPTPKIQTETHCTPRVTGAQLRTHKINLLGTNRVLPGNLNSRRYAW